LLKQLAILALDDLVVVSGVGVEASLVLIFILLLVLLLDFPTVVQVAIRLLAFDILALLLLVKLVHLVLIFIVNFFLTVLGGMNLLSVYIYVITSGDELLVSLRLRVTVDAGVDYILRFPLLFLRRHLVNNLLLSLRSMHQQSLLDSKCFSIGDSVLTVGATVQSWEEVV